MAKTRLVGIDLFRTTAALAVIVVHASGLILYSDETPIQIDHLLPILMQFCRFAVPFFLAASFYFMVGKLLSAPERFETKTFLRSRVTRLLVPYALWSTLYVLVRLVKAIKSPEGTALLRQDPIFLIFLGGAAIHLYFLPLLFTGSLLIPLLKGAVVRVKSAWPTLLVISIVVYEVLFVTGNSFELGVNCLQQPQGCSVAFQTLLPPTGANPLARLISVGLLWAIRCAMYIFLSVGLQDPAVQRWLMRMQQRWIWPAVFLLATLGGMLEHFKVCYFPLSIYELGVGFGLLLWGVVLSRSLTSPLITQLGNISFGIYLVHYLILTFLFAALTKLPAALLAPWPPVVSVLLLSGVTFIVSSAVIFGLSRQLVLRRLLLSS